MNNVAGSLRYGAKASPYNFSFSEDIDPTMMGTSLIWSILLCIDCIGKEYKMVTENMHCRYLSNTL
jgi:hypothetical protein